MPTKSKKLNTIKTYRMSPNLACNLHNISIQNKISESQLVRDVLNQFIQENAYKIIS